MKRKKVSFTAIGQIGKRKKITFYIRRRANKGEEEMNANYVAGRKLEYLVVNTLKEHLPKNCTVHRTAGSHTGADVLVVQQRRCTKIQCKSKKVKK